MTTPTVTEILRTSAHSFNYVESDVPAGIALKTWSSMSSDQRGGGRDLVRALSLVPRPVATKIAGG
jgi:hypothetical protein